MLFPAHLSTRFAFTSAVILATATLAIFFSSCGTGRSDTPAEETATDEPPVAAFVATPAGAAMTMAFDGSASRAGDPSRPIQTFHWDFGDGSPIVSNGPQIDRTYATSGNFSVRLTVQDTSNRTDDVTRSITVTGPANQAPNAVINAAPTSGQSALTVDFDGGASSDPDGTIVSFAWQFGDSSGTTGPSATQHTYANAGTFQASLTVTDDEGATSTASVTINVTSSSNQSPTAAFSATPQIAPAPLLAAFDATASTDADGTIATYTWDFGDGTTGTGATAQHNYARPGQYNVVLTVSDDQGATASLTQIIDARPYENTANLNSPLGTNSSGILYYAGDYPFIDFMKSARAWVSVQVNPFVFDDGRAFDLDENGWIRSLQPNQNARTMMLVGNEFNDRLAGERFVVRYDGSGTFTYLAFSITVESRAPGRDVVVFNGDPGGIQINISAVDANDHLRNIRMVPSGGICEHDPTTRVADAAGCPGGDYLSFEDNAESIRFHPVFLDRIKTYSTFRFMNWGANLTDLAVSDWDDRPQVSDAFWSTEGVPIEVMIELANKMNMDPWISHPYLATDDYFRQSAALIRDRMEPGRRVYLEYSNEVWNMQYPQTRYALQRGIDLGLNSFSGMRDDFVGLLRFYSRRSRQMFEIYEAEFGGTDRLQRIMAAQPGNAFIIDRILEFEDAASHTDNFAIAPYFGRVVGTGGGAGLTAQQEVDFFKAMTIDEVFDWLINDNLPELPTGALPLTDRNLRRSIAGAAVWGKPVVTYEGGQHFVAAIGFENDADLNNMLIAINRDPRMGDMYLRYFDNWRAAGGGAVFNHFVNVERPGRFGSWGALEYPTQPRSEAPKFDALQTWIADNPLP